MGLIIRPLCEADLAEAERIFRLAFGTHFHFSNPMDAFGDADYVYGRWRANPQNAHAAELEGKLVGSNFTTRWGSVGFFGPLTVDPNAWGRGIGKRLVAEAIGQFDDWNVGHRGLFTFSDSTKHISLYSAFNFWPRFLTALMAHDVSHTSRSPGYRLWSELDSKERKRFADRCVSLTDLIYRGLDVSSEIDAVERLSLGDTILVEGGDCIDGFAVCHCGSRTEAGNDVCYIKFAAAQPLGVNANAFSGIIASCEHFAARRRCSRVVCGINYGRTEAVNILVGLGYKPDSIGITMHGDNLPGYSQPGQMVIDDWR